MTSHMPKVPPGNQSDKGPARDTSAQDKRPQNTAEQGDSANIRQNTTTKGYFHGRRVK